MLKFSVLMSVYKNEKTEYLKQAIESILYQTVSPNEIVIVKDGRLPDDLNTVIDEYRQRNQELFKILDFDQNRGLGLALRDGVLACSHEYIARMDSDDICEPTRFERQIQYLKENPHIALLGTWIKEFSLDAHTPDTATDLPCTHQDIVRFAQSRNPFRHMTVIFSKQAVLDSGNYRDFLWFEDYDLWVRMIQKNYQVANLPEYLVNVRAEQGMFARRGGWKYLRQDMRFQTVLRQGGFINFVQYIKNITVRGFVRIMPNNVRILFYKVLLRKSV